MNFIKNTILTCILINTTGYASEKYTITDYTPCEKAKVTSMFEKNARFLGYDYDDSFIDDRFLNIKENQSAKVLKSGQKTIGLVNYETDNFGNGSVNYLVINKPNRNHGYAAILLEHSLTDMKSKGIESITTSIHPENRSASELFQKGFGFDFTGFNEYRQVNSFTKSIEPESPRSVEFVISLIGWWQNS